MKNRPSLLAALIAVSCLGCQAWAQEPSPTEQPDASEKRVVRSVDKRVDAGDYGALQELKALPREKALYALEGYARESGGTPPGQVAAAIGAMADLKVEPIYEARLAELADQRTEGVEGLLHRLAKFRTKAAVRIIAKYLFDERSPIVLEDDVRYAAYRFEAATALGEMDLSDAPTKKIPILYQQEELRLWREWWKANHARFE